MKRLLTMLGLAVSCLGARAQTDPAYPLSPAASGITGAEVFVDTDPGFGAGTPVALTAGTDVTTIAGAPTASLAPGVHTFYVRSRSSAGNWSLTASRQFLVDFDPPYPALTSSQNNVVRAEYFVDTDPGQGQGSAIAVTAATTISNLTFSLPTGSLPTGSHRVFVRIQNATGQWSMPEWREFAVTQDYPYPAPTAPGSIVVKAEYFIDTDPGYGQGIAIPLTAGADVPGVTAGITTGALSIGLHRVAVRTQDAAGRWSASSIHEVLVTDDFAYPTAPPPAGNVVQAEYFIDADPGFGLATPVALTPGADIANASIGVNTTGLSAGNHTLYIRSRQNPWSITVAREFSVTTPLPLTLVGFSAEKSGAVAVLSWETADEQGMDYFEAQRSADGRAWQAVGRVAANGGPRYSLTDRQPLSGKNLYRLKMVGRGADVSYSSVKGLHFGTDASAVVLRPNPAQARFYADGVAEGAVLEVWSMAGARVATYAATSGGYDVSALPAGTYFVRIAGEAGASLPLIKL